MVVEAGKRWRNMSEEDKTPYKDKASRLKEDFERQMDGLVKF